MRFLRFLPLLFWSLACLCFLPGLRAQQADAPLDPSAGEYLKFPEDGTPWKHPHTDLKFPQLLGDFELRQGFKAKQAEGGTALTYVHQKSDIKADILLAPCPKEVAVVVDIMPAVEEHLRQMARELRQIATTQGYVEDEDKRGSVERGKIDLWKIGIVPVAQMKMELKAKNAADSASHPTLTQWLSVILYQDSWVQTSVVMPVSLGAEGEKLREEFIRMMVQLIREPSLFGELLLLCDDYVRDPLSDKGREGADHLWRFSKESPVLEITLPGEALTPALDELATFAPGAEMDLLRAYIVGSGAKTLMDQSIDARLEEGARLMTVVYDLIKKKDPKAKSPFMDELVKVVAEKKAADWLRKRMNAPQSR